MNVYVTDSPDGKNIGALLLTMFIKSRKEFISPLATVRLRVNSSNTKTSPAIAVDIMISKYVLEKHKTWLSRE